MRMKKRAAIANIGIDADAPAFDRPLIADRMIHADALKWLRNNEYTNLPDTLIYCDPPYLMETRRRKNPLYNVEMGDAESHAALLAIIKSLQCMVMISGYWSELYSCHLQDWRCISFQAMTRGGKMATEFLWMNYPEPVELHDYRFLGSNFRERERIKRKQARWRSRLTKMDTQERYALLSVLADLSTPETAIQACIDGLSDSTR